MSIKHALPKTLMLNKSSSNQYFENSYGELFSFNEPIKMIPRLEKSHHSFTRYDI